MSQTHPRHASHASIFTRGPISAHGSLSPDSFRPGRMPVMAELGHNRPPTPFVRAGNCAFDMWMTRTYTTPMAEDPKGQKHHYIPVFYLKQWMGPQETVCEFSRPRDRVKTRHVHPDGTGYVRGLYAIDDLDHNVVNAIENMLLKPSDGMAAEALHCLLREEPFPHPARMRHAWTRFLLSLLLRYPEAIGQMKKQLRKNVERMYIEHRKPEEPESFAEYEATLGANDLAQLHGKLMVDLMQDSKMGRLIFGINWGVVAFTNCKHELLTSDRPVVSNKFPISANMCAFPSVRPRCSSQVRLSTLKESSVALIQEKS
jgi:hypothetical protein